MFTREKSFQQDMVIVHDNDFRINYWYLFLSNILYFYLLEQALALSHLDTLSSLD